MVVITVCGGGCACVVVVVAAVHGGDGHPCVSVVVLLYDYIHASKVITFCMQLTKVYR